MLPAKAVLSCLCGVLCIVVTSAQRTRGVSITKAALYTPSKEFTCLDGSKTIPYHSINDDYCDCQDGSDEPGTAACPNGSFHCTNAGHRPLNIPSSRVNDGICDCCDASDEYNGAACANTCKELGRAARIEAQKRAELYKKGYELRAELIKQGKNLKQEKQAKIHVLEKEKQEAEYILQEKTDLKTLAEEPEKEALERYKQIEEENRKQQEEAEKAQQEREALEKFDLLDSNQDGKIDLAEVQVRQTFDQNKDGVVSEEEAKFFIQSGDEMTKEEFLKSGWLIMQPYFMMEKGMFAPPQSEEGHEENKDTLEENPHVDEEMDEDEADLLRENLEEPTEDDDGEAEYENEEEPAPEDNQPEEQAGSQYDEETQRLIDAASEARKEFETADQAVKDIANDIRHIQESLDRDYGFHEEFAALDGQCFEYEDNEYIYKLCPFDQAIQKSKSGGSEVRLGGWSRWNGPPDDKYSGMLYDKGQSCWNGPQRSTTVLVSCDVENKLTSVSEPNKCEYRYEFSTPAMCNQLPSEEHDHDEL